MLKFFDKDLDTMELKFLGFFFCIILGTISLILHMDIITGFLGGIIMMQGRDLYRTDTNSAPRGLNGGGKSDKNTVNPDSSNISN